MALGYKPKVHLPEDAPVRSRRSVSPLALPVAAYWSLSAAFVYGVSTGELPLQQWLESEQTEIVSPDATALIAPAPTPRTHSPGLPGGHVTRMRALRGSTRTDRVEVNPAPPLPPPGTNPGAATPMPDLPSPEPAFEAAKPTAAPMGPPLGTPSAALAPAEPASSTAPPGIPFPQAAPRALARSAVSAGPGVTAAAPVPPSPPGGTRVPGGLSCEAALARAAEELDLTTGARGVPDLPREAFARILDRGAYFSHCGVPDAMSIDICAAVQQGVVVGLTVVTQPPNDGVRACIADAVRRLSFPNHPRLDVARTHFDPSR